MVAGMSAPSPSSRRVVLGLGTVKGVFFYASDEGRRDWRLTGPALPGMEVFSLGGDLARGRLIAGTEQWERGPTIRLSDDGGLTWREAQRDPAFAADSEAKLKHIWRIVPGHPSQPGTWYAGTDDAALFVSRDDGETWDELSGLQAHPSRPMWMPGAGGLCLHSIVVDPQSPDRLWVAISAVGVFRSEDGGATWSLCNQGLPNVAPEFIKGEDMGRCVHRLELDPSAPNALVLQFHFGVYRSTDGGDSWTKISAGLPHDFGFPLAVTQDDLFVVPLVRDSYRVVPDGIFKVWRSRDRGRTWKALTQGLPPADCFVGVLRDAMTADGLDPAGIYLGTTGGEVFVSSDAGGTWQGLPARLPRITSVQVWVV